MNEFLSTATAANWKRAVGNMITALTDLEVAGNGILDQLADNARQSAAAIEAADKRLEEVSANAEAAAARARSDAQTQIDELHQLINRLRTDLEAQRDARQRSTPAIAADAGQPAETAPSSSAADATADPASTTSERVAANQESTAGAAPAETASPAFDGNAYAVQLLDHLESVYLADEAAGIGPSDLVDRLIANLLYASEVYARRSGAPADRANDAFHQRVTAALVAKSGTSFGRHLSIAAFELARRRQDGRAQVA
jgi:hypothetical protein